MKLSHQIASHFRQVYFGKNWTAVHIKEQLSDVNLAEALISISGTNSILTLLVHMHYYVVEVTKVLDGNPLQSKDELSFETPQLQSEEAWQELLNTIYNQAELFAKKIDGLPDDVFEKDFTDSKYGNYYRNIHGIIEHLHYHLGQIVIVKKIIRATRNVNNQI